MKIASCNRANKASSLDWKIQSLSDSRFDKRQKKYFTWTQITFDFFLPDFAEVKMN